MLALPRQVTSVRVLAVAGAVVVAVGALVARNVVTSQQAAPATQTAASPRVVAAVVQAAPATRGGIRSVLSYAGAAQASQQVNLVPRANGIVKEVPVEVGSPVRKGDVLAVLDPGTLPDVLAQARAAQAVAQVKLDQIRAGARPEDIAAAQAQVDQAQAKFDGLRARPEDVASAQAALDSANAKLSLLASGSTPDVRQAAQAGVDNARASLTSAQAKLDLLKAGATNSDVQAAQATVNNAQASLNSAQAKLTLVQAPTASDRLAAEASLASAEASLVSAQGVLTCVQNAAPVAATAKGCASSLNASGSGSYDVVLALAQAPVTSATAARDAAKAKRDLLVAGGSSADLAAAQAAAYTAFNNLQAAQAKSALVSAGATTADLAAAQAAVDTAKNNLAAAQAKLSEVQAPTPEEIAQSQATVRQAQQVLAKAQQPFLDTDIAQQQQVINQLAAQGQLKASPFTDFDIRSAHAAVDQARSAVAVAQVNLDLLTLSAPFDGVVSQKFLAPGGFASTATPILTLVSNSTEVHITVEEARLGLVRPGHAVQLVTAAYPDTAIIGSVTSIAPAGDARAHTFDATIIPEDTDGRLLPGMFVQVQVMAADKPDALLVPREAVLQKETGATVFVAQDGRVEARPVQVGLSDQSRVEIVDGLSEGEQVVTVGQNSLKDGQPITIPGQQGGNQGGRAGGQSAGQAG